AMKRTAVKFDAVDRESKRNDHVDVGRVGAEQARGKCKARAALEPHFADQRAGQGVGDIVHELSSPAFAGEGDRRRRWRGSGSHQKNPSTSFAGPPPHEIVERIFIPQSLCGSFSTIHVWPLETS